LGCQRENEKKYIYFMEASKSFLVDGKKWGRGRQEQERQYIFFLEFYKNRQIVM